MFGFLKGKKSELISPLTGTCVSVTEVEDIVFKDKVLGDGVAIIPTSGDVFAPISGTIVQVAHTGHAICIESDDGLEVLVHLGFDTVGLGGEGFAIKSQVGDKVSAGDFLGTMDLAFVQSKGLSTVSPCIIINLNNLKSFDILPGEVTGGKSPVLSYKVK